MALVSPEATIDFLLVCLEHSEGCDFDAIARDSGHYKAGKYAKQALGNIQKRYGKGKNPLPPTKAKATENVKKQPGRKRKLETEAATKGRDKKQKKAEPEEDVESEVDGEAEIDEDAGDSADEDGASGTD